MNPSRYAGAFFYYTARPVEASNDSLIDYGWRASLAVCSMFLQIQEQQEKQLELILAIGEASRILGDRQDMLGGETARSSKSAPEKVDKQANIKAETLAGGNSKP